MAKEEVGADITGNIDKAPMTKEIMEQSLRQRTKTNRRKFNKYLMGSSAGAVLRNGLA